MSGHGHLHQALRLCLDRWLTFAAFRAPGGPVTLWAQRNPELEPVDAADLDRLNGVFLVAPFHHDPRRTRFVRSDVELTFTELPVPLEPLNECGGTIGEARQVPTDMDRQGFEQMVRQALGAIAAGPMEKVVVSRTVTMDLMRADAAALFEEALHRMPNAMVALVHTPDHGTWLGASPERLLVAEDERVRVDALAATRRTTDAPGDAEAWNAKERWEQALVTREVADRLIGLGLPRITITGPRPMAAGDVAHLHTVVEADLGARSLDELVTALHPTPAVCGTPRTAAQTFIAAHDGPGRGLYTGFWGPWNADGRTELFVNIRCMELLGGKAALHVGAGITQGSDPAMEWEETQAKADVWARPVRALAAGRVSSPAR